MRAVEKFTIFRPGRSFPSVSITGSRCMLDCKHCNGKYLQSMVDAHAPEKLLDFASRLHERGGEGMLISGGFDRTGKLPLDDFINAIADIKEKTDFFINIHPGMASPQVLDGLKEAGIDSLSIDIFTEETAREIYGLDYSLNDYIKNYARGVEAGLRVVPHFTLGLPGDHEKAFASLPDKPARTIINGLVGTRGPKTDNVKKSMVEFSRFISENGKGTEIVAGCMRPRLDPEYEIAMVKNGTLGMVNPASVTRKWVEENYDVRVLERCCSL